jgi:hypothetical protein
MEENVPKRRHIKFRRPGITQDKAHKNSKRSLPYSKQPATCRGSEPDQSSPAVFYFMKIWFDVILPSTPRHSKLSLYSTSPPYRTLYAPILFPCHMPCPSHSSRFDHPNVILWAVQIIKLLVTCFIFSRANDLYLCLYNQLFALFHYVFFKVFNTLKL